MTAGGDQRIQRIVVPLDDSTFSETALPTAFRLAKRLDADVFLFSVVDTVDDKPDRLRRLRSIVMPGRPVALEVVVNRDPAGAIHEMLRRLPASVACMASRAQRPLGSGDPFGAHRTAGPGARSGDRGRTADR